MSFKICCTARTTCTSLAKKVPLGDDPLFALLRNKSIKYSRKSKGSRYGNVRRLIIICPEQSKTLKSTIDRCFHISERTTFCSSKWILTEGVVDVLEIMSKESNYGKYALFCEFIKHIL